MLARFNNLLDLFGIKPGKTLKSLKELPWFLASLREARKQWASGKADFDFGKLYPCLHDRHDVGGVADGHYFHQDLLVAQKIFAKNPERHVDIGSRVDGFVAHVASFREIEVIDIRPLRTSARNVVFRQGNMMSGLDESLHASCDSLSCLHALEHFGLGRYGDPVNLDGHQLGFRNMSQMLRRGGSFYLSVPIGPQRVEFNAHRVFSMTFLLDMVEKEFDIQSFSYVDDAGELHANVPLGEEDVRTNFDCHYGCGILELVKA